jgi:hypothetical protein
VIAHFALSYVLRYGGQLEESARECDIAFSLDPGDYQIRSCGMVFESLGEPARAFDFFRSDPGSEWVLTNIPMALLRMGKTAEAKESARKVFAEAPNSILLRGCLAQPPDADKQIKEVLALVSADPDPENRFWAASVMTACERKPVAIQLVKSAVKDGYCAYTALLRDPAYAGLRNAPEYPQILNDAKQCRDKFVAETAQLSH